MSRLGDLARPKGTQDNFYTDLNVVCDLDSDLAPSPSRLPFNRILLYRYAGRNRVMSTSAVDHGRLPERLPEHMLGGMAAGQPTEADPLIPDTRPRKKPFYRARPLWHVLRPCRCRPIHLVHIGSCLSPSRCPLWYVLITCISTTQYICRT